MVTGGGNAPPLPGPCPGSLGLRLIVSPGLCANFRGVSRMNEPKPTIRLSSSFALPGLKVIWSPTRKPSLFWMATNWSPGMVPMEIFVSAAGSGVAVGEGILVAVAVAAAATVGTWLPPPPPPVVVFSGVGKPPAMTFTSALPAAGSTESWATAEPGLSIVCTDDLPFLS